MTSNIIPSELHCASTVLHPTLRREVQGQIKGLPFYKAPTLSKPRKQPEIALAKTRCGAAFLEGFASLLQPLPRDLSPMTLSDLTFHAFSPLNRCDISPPLARHMINLRVNAPLDLRFPFHSLLRYLSYVFTFFTWLIFPSHGYTWNLFGFWSILVISFVMASLYLIFFKKHLSICLLLTHGFLFLSFLLRVVAEHL